MISKRYVLNLTRRSERFESVSIELDKAYFNSLYTSVFKVMAGLHFH